MQSEAKQLGSEMLEEIKNDSKFSSHLPELIKSARIAKDAIINPSPKTVNMCKHQGESVAGTLQVLGNLMIQFAHACMKIFAPIMLANPIAMFGGSHVAAQHERQEGSHKKGVGR